MGRQSQRRNRQRTERRRQQRQQQPVQTSNSSRNWLIAGIATVVVVAVVLVIAATGLIKGASAPPTPTPLPTAPPAPVVDGIPCNTSEQVAYHIHQYLELFDNGKQLSVPADVGIPSLVPGNEQYATCLYWLHVHHAYPNVIHVESPSAKTYTLGDFFDIWKATKKYTDPPGDAFLQRLEAAPAGSIHVFVNGKPYTKGYRTIVLRQHEVIAVELGKQVPPKPFTNWGSL
jgi:hypothetical protein